MMKQLIITAISAMLLLPVQLYAQEVYIDGGKVILDLSVAAGMPADAVTTVSKTTLYDANTPSTSSYITGNLTRETISVTVYEKLEVSLIDPGTYTWVKAYTYCKDLTEASSSDWRLPTQRELMLMYVFKPALDAAFFSLSATAFSSADYWSATEVSTVSANYVSFSNGYTYSYNKPTNNLRVRCVREVP